MVIMSTNDVNIPAEEQNKSTSDASWYILDETGDTTVYIHPENITIPEGASSSLEEGEIDSRLDSSTTFEDAREEVTVVENQLSNQSSKLEDASEGFSSEIEFTKCVSSAPNCEQDMKRGLPLRSVPLNITPRSTPKNRKTKKRKRKAVTPASAQKNATPRAVSGRGPKRSKKRKKSVILIDSESEPEPSVIEIDDESIIVLSDDEVGVCSGTVTKPRTNKRNQMNTAQKPGFPIPIQDLNTVQKPGFPIPIQDLNTVQKPGFPIPIHDLTGNYIPTKGESSKAADPPEKPEKNIELYQPMENKTETKTGLRPIVIDGCNVAFGHGRDRFSSLGLKICVDYFKKLGHKVHVFIPQFRKHHNATTDPQLLDQMEKDGILSYTPSRRADGKMIVSYDDRFIVQYADASGGVIVSKDNYRDLLNENPEWKETINKRLLMYTWVGDTIMFPKDPLGRHGPSLQEFLKF